MSDWDGFLLTGMALAVAFWAGVLIERWQPPVRRPAREFQCRCGEVVTVREFDIEFDRWLRAHEPCTASNVEVHTHEQ